MTAKTESLISIITSIIPEEFQTGCNRLLYEWMSQMMLILAIKMDAKTVTIWVSALHNCHFNNKQE